MRSLLLAVVGGLAMNAAFPDLNWWPLAYVSLAMLWVAVAQSRAWAALGLGWVFGLAFFLPHVWWAHEAVGLVPWLALSLAAGLFMGLFAAAWVLVRDSSLLLPRSWLGPIVFALLWVGVEQLRSIVPFGGFPWGRIAFSQLDVAVSRLAWLGGAPLTGFVIALAGALLGAAAMAIAQRRILVATGAPLVAAGLLLVGLLVPLGSQPTDGRLRIGVVQGNVPNAGLDAFANAREVTRNHHAQTMALVASDPGPIDLLLWPENSSDYDPRTDEQAYALVTAAAEAADAPLLLGTNDYSPEGGRYNASLLWSPQGAVLDVYNKQRPAPFAEYVPMRDVARMFSDAVDLVTHDVLPGQGSATVRVAVPELERIVRLGTVICFEVAFDDIVTDSIADGAEVLLVQTNNANFGLTAESTQQLAMTRLRAIETGRAAIQASTVGVSGVVEPTGRLVDSTELFTPDFMYASVPLRDEITPAVRFRHAWQWGFLVLPALIWGSAVIRRMSDRYEW